MTHVGGDRERCGFEAVLDALAHGVATMLESGVLDGAWAVTVALERAAGSTADGAPRPAGPVIGRRFAAAHRRILADVARHSAAAAERGGLR